MPLTRDTKKKVISDYKTSKNDVGSSEVQVALLTQRINELSGHFKDHVKDHHSRYGLIKLVNRRKKLLAYLQKTDKKKYQDIIARLDLRK